MSQALHLHVGPAWTGTLACHKSEWWPGFAGIRNIGNDIRRLKYLKGLHRALPAIVGGRVQVSICNASYILLNSMIYNHLPTLNQGIAKANCAQSKRFIVSLSVIVLEALLTRGQLVQRCLRLRRLAFALAGRLP
jgi:hypothetical protein